MLTKCYVIEWVSQSKFTGKFFPYYPNHCDGCGEQNWKAEPVQQVPLIYLKHGASLFVCISSHI